jgi:outer membrane protein OmpA-like peptidoglycan-associated protein
VENRLGEAETRLNQSEENALRLSGQVSEISALSEAARGAARAAQETADQALASAQMAGESANGAKAGVVAANERISALDDFDTKGRVLVYFNVGSALLSKEAKTDLDKLADEAKNERGFLIEVSGFASSDGSASANQVLSQHRADAVIRYLAENHRIPLRRFITPFGYGENRPVADNSTRAGRKANRRVEVRVLVSKGLAQATAL